jgi:MFS transporter, DHA1 family, solute carrier family 18 (vesicular amine transporter), member 1/2
MAFHEGVMTDLLVYSVVIPVFPFRLESLRYHHVSGLVGWLLFAFVRAPTAVSFSISPALADPTRYRCVSLAAL